MEKIHPETGEILHRDIYPQEFNYRGEKIILDMPGWYNSDGTDAIFTMKNMAVHDRAFEILKARHAAKMQKNNFTTENVAFA